MRTVTEKQIRERATKSSFERGEAYYQEGRVGAFTYRDDVLQAVVEGSGGASYQVEITLIGSVIVSATCTCPYDGEGDCKHIVAVLLTFVRHQDTDSRVSAPAPQSPDELLKQMTADQLRKVIDMLRQQKPELEDWLRVALPGIVTPEKPVERHTPAPPVDTVAFRRQVQRAVDLLDYNNHWNSVWMLVDALDEAHSQATAYMERGDFNNALALMRIIGEEVAPDYGNLEEECQLAGFMGGWGEDLTVAILGADLSDSERKALGEQMTEWHAELSDFGLDDVLYEAIGACMQTDSASPNDTSPSNMSEAWLDVLAYKGDDVAYLEACLQQGAHYRYVHRLTALGRIDEVIAHVAQHPLKSKNELVDLYLHLVKFIEQEGHIEAAYQIGVSSISRPDTKSGLASWVAERAEKRGQLQTAQQAWRIAFTDNPSLEVYRRLKSLSGDDWSALRLKLIAPVKNTDILIEIAIEDGDINRAIQLWDKTPYGGYELLDRLVTAAAETHPDWAAGQALAEAQRLIKRGSKYYPHVVRWLEKVKAIYTRHNRAEDWQQAVAAIRAEHGRKYSLMSQMEIL